VDERLCFVQFLHPGGEHAPDAGLIKAWNTGDHRRKFLKSPGCYLAGNVPRDGEIVFWGEWEPESRLAAAITALLPHGPRWVYEPYYLPLTSYRVLQNTGPQTFPLGLSGGDIRTNLEKCVLLRYADGGPWCGRRDAR
jgi:hypothetical protein